MHADKRIFIFDMDGTLADCEHRRHLIDGSCGKKDFQAFYERMYDDVPNEPVAQVYRALRLAGYRLVVVSARPLTYRAQTLKWLNQNALWPNELWLLREDAKHTVPDVELKRMWLFEQFGDEAAQWVAGVFDDRKRIAQMWRAQGLSVFHVAEGDF